MNMEGWKTGIWGGVNVLFWGLNALGIQIDGSEELITQASAAIFTVVSITFLVLRHVTRGQAAWRKGK